MDKGRREVVRWLQEEVIRATTADLQRAAEFLEFARDVRRGCKVERRAKRRRTFAPKQRNSEVA